MVASDLALARHLRAGTVHLAADDPWPERRRPRRSGAPATTTSDLAAAAAHGAAYATLSPVFPTPQQARLRARRSASDGLAELVAGCPVPVLALGGIDPANAARLPGRRRGRRGRHGRA